MKARAETRESALCRMIDLRQAHDERIRSDPDPRHWLIRGLWESPEISILQAISSVAWRRDGGVALADAWQLACPFASAEIASATSELDAMRASIRQMLTVVDPIYLNLGQDIIDGACAVACEFVDREIHSIMFGPPNPPVEWLFERTSLAEFLHELFESRRENVPVTRSFLHAIEMSGRWVPGDEFWRYRSSSESWANLAGRAGFALVRHGRPIAHTTTKMS